jgi:hypothetical protein
MPCAPTPEQDLTIVTNFDPPWFSLDNTFKGKNTILTSKIGRLSQKLLGKKLK